MDGTICEWGERAGLFSDIKNSRSILAILVCLFLFVGVTHYSSSPLRNVIQNQPFFNCDDNPTGVDSLVFMYIGRLITQGGIPYRDAFDHKGPLVYLFDALGISLGGVFGIWLLELLFLVISICFVYNIARSFVSCKVALWTTVVAVLWYTARCDSNFCETWSVPFLLSAVYYWIDYVRNGYSLGKFRTFLVGLSCGAVLLIKANLTVVWLLFCAVVFVISIRKKAWSFLVSRICCFLAGMILVVVPIFVWLNANNAWNDFIDQYWKFNQIYCNVGFKSKLTTFVRCFACIPLESYYALFAVIGYPILAHNSKSASRRFFFLMLEVCLILSLMFLSMSGRSARHYFAPLVPAFVPFLACSFSWCFTSAQPHTKGMKRFVLLAVLLVPTVIYDIPMFRPVRDMVKMAILTRIHPQTDYSRFNKVYGYPYFYEEIDAAEIVKWLKENTKPDTRIANFGIGGRVFYWYARRQCVTKYFYIRDTHLENGYLPEIIAEIKEKNPDVFIFQLKGGYPLQLSQQMGKTQERKVFTMPEELRGWLAEKQYEKVFVNGTYEIYRK